MQQQIERLLNQWNLHPWVWNLILAGLALVAGLLIRLLLVVFVRKKAEEERRFSFFHSLLRYMGQPLNFFLPLFLLNMLLPAMRLTPLVASRLRHAVEIGLIVCFAWILIRGITIVQEFVIHRFDIKKADNLRERKVRTQLQFIRRLLVAVIMLLTIAAVLFTFSTMRKIGTGLLTGVGIGGIIIGFAAQRSLANLLAGFQIAFTQPIRIDDEVLVEDEFGKIEEITLTYVVVHLWNDKRLILPINYFIEKPFQNWTRVTSQLLDTVYIYADYSLPTEPLRQELARLLKDNPLWDGRAGSLQVTNATEQAMELRVVVSARNSGASFDLRCQLREQLLTFIRQNYPDSLPRTRVLLEGGSKV
jgi:small-conductance mechanosensitive channel